MSELTNNIYTEKYRPQLFDDLILEGKESLLKYLEDLQSIPSFIFHSTSPGTGKTSCAQVIINKLGCDSLKINASDERGIDHIRATVKLFVQSLSTVDGTKRCVFMDEGDGLTKEAQDSLKNLMETYSNNCFFIFSCNDISKLIEPIKSRCILVSFENPDKDEIFKRLGNICEKEKIECDEPTIIQLIDRYYPDIRGMIKDINRYQLNNEIEIGTSEFIDFYEALKRKDVDYIYSTVYSQRFNVQSFNRWFFKELFLNWKDIGIEKTQEIAILISDIEKSWKINVNLEIVAIANYLKIMRIL